MPVQGQSISYRYNIHSGTLFSMFYAASAPDWLIRQGGMEVHGAVCPRFSPTSPSPIPRIMSLSAPSADHGPMLYDEPLSPPASPAFNTSTTARSIANNSLPSCPSDPSDGGTSMDRKICFLKRRAGHTWRWWSVRCSRARWTEYHRDAVPSLKPYPNRKTDTATSPQQACLA